MEKPLQVEDHIRKNKRDTVFIVVMMFILLFAVIIAIGLILGVHPYVAMILGIPVALFYVLITYSFSVQSVIAAAKARPANPQRREEKILIYKVEEMALAAAIKLAEKSGLVFLAAGTDGTDGPTDAAGAVVNGQTIARGQEKERDAQQYLARHDAYSYFEGMDEHIITGPTRTNVMDVYLLLADHK